MSPSRMIDDRTMVPLAWMIGLSSVTILVSVVLVSWMNRVDYRLAAIEQKVGILPPPVPMFIPHAEAEIHGSETKTQ